MKKLVNESLNESLNKSYENTFIVKRKFIKAEVSSPGHNYAWNDIVEWVWYVSAIDYNWGITFTLPKVATFEMNDTGIKVIPIGDLKKDKFRYGEGTNFDKSVIGYNWYQKKTSMKFLFSILVSVCSRAALVNKLNFNGLEIEYNENLSKFGYPMGKHQFDPINNDKDFYNWVQHAPRILSSRGTFHWSPELEEALLELGKLLPDTLELNTYGNLSTVNVMLNTFSDGGAVPFSILLSKLKKNYDFSEIHNAFKFISNTGLINSNGEVGQYKWNTVSIYAITDKGRQFLKKLNA